jgi:hypothetical protein
MNANLGPIPFALSLSKGSPRQTGIPIVLSLSKDRLRANEVKGS